MPPRENERVPVRYNAMNMTNACIDDKMQLDDDVDMRGAQQRGETGGKRSQIQRKRSQWPGCSDCFEERRKPPVS